MNISNSATATDIKNWKKLTNTMKDFYHGKWKFANRTNCEKHKACEIADNMFTKKKKKLSLDFYLYYSQYWYSVENKINAKISLSIRRRTTNQIIKEFSLKFSFKTIDKEFFNSDYLRNLR